MLVGLPAASQNNVRTSIGVGLQEGEARQGGFSPHQFRLLIFFQAVIKIWADAVCCSHQMPDFSAKMHQIQFRLGLQPQTPLVSLQRSPRPRSCSPRALSSYRPFGPRYSACRASILSTSGLDTSHFFYLSPQTKLAPCTPMRASVVFCTVLNIIIVVVVIAYSTASGVCEGILQVCLSAAFARANTGRSTKKLD